jgi:hypothetical protein
MSLFFVKKFHAILTISCAIQIIAQNDQQTTCIFIEKFLSCGTTLTKSFQAAIADAQQKNAVSTTKLKETGL